MQQEPSSPHVRRRVAAGTVAGLAGALFVQGAAAFPVDTGNEDLQVRFDNTVRYSTALRVKERDTRVYAGAAGRDVSSDDGDRNFDRGLISNRIDLFSELDAEYKGFGARLSGAAWYDAVYNRRNDHDSPTTANQVSVPYDEFPRETRELHGRKAEVLDAFIFGRIDALGGMRVRLGRFAQLWGESLFFGSNGIAAGMAPTDVIKAQSSPGATAKEIVRPVAQVSFSSQLSSTVGVTGYYQFQWEKNRFPGTGSYFSTNDFVFAGGERFLPSPPGFTRQADLEAKDRGQFGLSLRLRPAGSNAEFGLYALRYHDKAPKVYVAMPGNGYRIVYPEGIRAFGASFNTTVGDAAIAGEVSHRRNLPLVSPGRADAAGTGDNHDHPLYAIGKSLHANVNVQYAVPRLAWWDNASLLGEVAVNRLLSVDRNPAALDPNTRRNALAFRLVFSPQWLGVMPALDLTMPVGFGYSPHARSATVGGFGVQNGGDVNVGLNFNYQSVWDARVLFVRYLGPAGPATITGLQTFYQALKDRNFVSFSVARSF